MRSNNLVWYMLAAAIVVLLTLGVVAFTYWPQSSPHSSSSSAKTRLDAEVKGKDVILSKKRALLSMRFKAPILLGVTIVILSIYSVYHFSNSDSATVSVLPRFIVSFMRSTNAYLCTRFNTPGFIVDRVLLCNPAAHNQTRF